MTIRLARVAALALLISAALARPTPVEAAPYRFDYLGERAPPTNPYYGGVRLLPALNDSGTVAFVLPRSDNPDSVDEVMYTGTPGNLRPVETPGVVPFGGVSINNLGRIGFIGGVSGEPSSQLSAVTPGGPVVTIASGAFAILGSAFYETAISDSGAVMALSDQPQHFPSSVVIGDGTGPAQVVFRTRPLAGGNGGAVELTSPRMSAGGDWTAHDFEFDGPGYAAVLSSQGSYSTFSLQFSGIGSSDVAGDGVVVFQATPSATYPGTPFGTRRALFTFHDNDKPRIIPGSEALPGGTVAMNDAGEIALLEGPSRGAGTRLWMLRNGLTETVLSAGDPLLGSTVTTIGFDPKGFNNSDQFALLVGLADGRDVYVLASPVPEAGGLVVIAAAGAMTMGRRRVARAFGSRGGA